MDRGKRDRDRQLSREEHPGLLSKQHADASTHNVTNPIGRQALVQRLSMKSHYAIISMVPNAVETPPAQVKERTRQAAILHGHGTMQMLATASACLFVGTEPCRFSIEMVRARGAFVQIVRLDKR